MRHNDNQCPKCKEIRNVRAEFCPQPRNNREVILCELTVTTVPHQHYRCKKCNHSFILLLETRRLNID